MEHSIHFRTKTAAPKRLWVLRILIYLAGIIILAFGITLNTKTGLGVSPIISIPYSISQLCKLNLGTMTFLFYSLLVVLQIVLLRRDFKLWQLLQVIMSLITSFFIDRFDILLPMAETVFQKGAVLLLAIVFTGLGASLTVGMKIVPNPADGFASVLGQKLKKGFGFGKNIFDLSCLAIALILGIVFAGKLLGIGAGTVIAMLLTGRVVALCQAKLYRLYEKLTA